MLLWAIRSADLLGAAGRPVPIGPLVPMTALANTVNNLTPGSVGELLRLYLLRERHGVDYPTGAAVVLIERVVAIGYLAGSAAIAWLVHLRRPAGPRSRVVGFVVLAVIAGGRLRPRDPAVGGGHRAAARARRRPRALGPDRRPPSPASTPRSATC